MAAKLHLLRPAETIVTHNSHCKSYSIRLDTLARYSLSILYLIIEPHRVGSLNYCNETGNNMCEEFVRLLIEMWPTANNGHVNMICHFTLVEYGTFDKTQL